MIEYRSGLIGLLSLAAVAGTCGPSSDGRRRHFSSVPRSDLLGGREDRAPVAPKDRCPVPQVPRVGARGREHPHPGEARAAAPIDGLGRTRRGPGCPTTRAPEPAGAAARRATEVSLGDAVMRPSNRRSGMGQHDQATAGGSTRAHRGPPSFPVRSTLAVRQPVFAEDSMRSGASRVAGLRSPRRRGCDR